jgi:hypothetical protein
MRIERCHVIVRVPAERVGDSAFLELGQIITLAHIVEALHLDHEMVETAFARSDHRKAVMATIDVQKIQWVRREAVIGDLKAQQIAVERQQVIHGNDVHHDMPHSKRPGLEAGNRPAGLERIGCNLLTMEYFDPVTARIAKTDKFGDAPFVGERPCLPGHGDAGFIETARQFIKIGSAFRFPAEKAESVVLRAGHDEPLLPVVHAKRPHLPRGVDLLHAQEAGGKATPIFQLGGLNSDISERFEGHCFPPGGDFRRYPGPTTDARCRVRR